MRDRKLVKYLIFAFALAWPLQTVASLFALQGNLSAFRAILAFSMFAPLLAAVLAGISLQDMGWRLHLKANWRWVLAAWLVPMGLTVLGAALYFLLFPAQVDFSGAYTLAQVRAQSGEAGVAEYLAQLEEKGLSLQIMPLIGAIQALTYAPVVNTVYALGEEVGWRGAMLPRLKARFGRRDGWLLGDVIWGVWHWPVMLLAGYEYGLEYWGAPVLGPLLFCLCTTALGLLLDLCYEKTGSIWLPALGHGAVNAAAGIPLLIQNPDYADQMILGPTMNGLIAGIPLFLLAAWVLLRAKTPTETAPETPAA